MTRALLEMLPLAVAGAVSPAVLGVCVLVLAAPDRGRRNGIAFFLGTLAFSVLFAGVMIVVLQHIGVVHRTQHEVRAGAVADLVLGVLLALWAIARIVRGPKPPRASNQHRAKRPLTFVTAWALGMFMMAVNFSTLPLYALAIRQIDQQHLARWSAFACIALLTAIILVPAWLPVAITVVAPRQSQRVLRALNVFFARHSFMILTVIIGVFGAVLILKAGPHLWP